LNPTSIFLNADIGFLPFNIVCGDESTIGSKKFSHNVQGAVLIYPLFEQVNLTAGTLSRESVLPAVRRKYYRPGVGLEYVTFGKPFLGVLGEKKFYDPFCHPDSTSRFFWQKLLFPDRSRPFDQPACKESIWV
jgi:hypothetical protein